MEVVTAVSAQLDEVRDILIAKISTLCGLPKKYISIDSPLIDLGIDSIIAAKINMEIEAELGVELPFDDITNGATINDVCKILNDKLSLSTQNLPKINVKLELEMQHTSRDVLPESYYNVRKLPYYRKIQLQKSSFENADIPVPFFRDFDDISSDTISIRGCEKINFGSYNYLGYCGHPNVSAAAKDAIDQFGTSAASSRLVSGEKAIHRMLERKIAELYDCEDAIVFVSGYLTNATVIKHLFGEGDLIIHDSLAHNSIVSGSEASGARRITFPHNDIHKLEAILVENRYAYERVLIAVEGLYSMDGDLCPLPDLVALKEKYQCLLMVDEAHSIGVLGETGKGIREHFSVPSSQVDIWMGTLSKTFASCGGYIAGCFELIEYLKYSAPGFVFSVGLSPVLAGASIAAIDLLMNDPSGVKKLQDNSKYFLDQAKKVGFNTGWAQGYAIVPVILSESQKTVKVANYLFEQGVNLQPIIYPGVSENDARLRFFISSLHSQSQIDQAIDLTAQCIEQVNRESAND